MNNVNLLKFFISVYTSDISDTGYVGEVSFTEGTSFIYLNDLYFKVFVQCIGNN